MAKKDSSSTRARMTAKELDGAVLQVSTARSEFFDDKDGNCLFSVCEGIPIAAALEQASCFLSIARVSALSAGDDGVQEEAYSAAYLIDMAKALVDSVSKSLILGQRQ